MADNSIDTNVGPSLAQADTTNFNKAIDSYKIARNENMQPDSVYDNYGTFKSRSIANTDTPSTPNVSTFVQGSKSQTALVSKDVQPLSELERQWGKLKNAPEKAIIGVENGKDNFSLLMRKLGMPDVAMDTRTDDEIYANKIKNEDRLKELSVYDRPDDFGSEVAPSVLGALTQLGQTVKNNIPLIAGTATTTAATGFIAGSIGGPIGEAIFSGAGIGLGASIGLTTAFTKDAFVNTAGSVYGAVIDQGKGISELTEQQKQDLPYYALGAGAVGAGLELVPGAIASRILTKNTSELLKKASAIGLGKIFKYGTNEEVKLGLVALGKQMATSGLANYLQQGSQAAFEQKAKGKNVNVPEAFISKEAFLSGITGALTPAALETITSIPTAFGTKVRERTTNVTGNLENTPPPDINVARDVTPTPPPSSPTGGGTNVTPKQFKFILNEKASEQVNKLNDLNSTLDNTEKLINETSIKDPEILGSISEEILHDSPTYFDTEDVRAKGDAYVKAFEAVTGRQLPEESKMIALNNHEMVKLMQVTNDVKNLARAEPNGPSKNDIIAWTGRIKANEDKVNQLFDQLDVATNPEEINRLKSEITQIAEDNTQGVFDIETATSRQIVPPTMKENLPSEFVTKVESDINDARAKVAESIIKNKNQQIDQIVSLDIKTEMDKRLEAIEEQLNQNDRLVIPDYFMNTDNQSLPPDIITSIKQIYPEYNTLPNDELIKRITESHQKTGYSVLAIDPTTLPNNLKNYADNKRLKEMKVFVKGGIPFEKLDKATVSLDSKGRLTGTKIKGFDIIARALGFKNSDRFLSDLSILKTRNELKSDLMDAALRDQYEQSMEEFGPDKQDYLAAFENKAKVHLKEIDLVLKEKTGTAKKLIKNLGRQVKTTDELKLKAKDISTKLTINELNPLIYRRNQTKAQATAAKALASGDFLKYFSSKENEALNTLLEGEVRSKISKINRNLSKIAKISRKDNLQNLKRAGESYYNTIVNLLELITYNPKRRPVDREQYLQLLEEKKNSLEGTLEIPEELLNDVKVYMSDMTYDQAEAITDFIISTNKKANEKYKIEMAEKTTKDIQDIASLRTYSDLTLGQRKDANLTAYDDLEIARRLSKEDFITKYANKFGVPLLNAPLSIWQGTKIYSFLVKDKLDRGNINGFWSKKLWNPLLDAYQNENTDKQMFVENKRKIIQDYGVEKYNNLKRDLVDVPEWSNHFKDGKATKEELISIILNLGSENYKQVEKDLGMTRDSIITVLKKHTDKSDFEFAQKLINSFKPLWEKNKKFLFSENDVVPREVQAIPIKFDDNTIYEGGYYPLVRTSTVADRLTSDLKNGIDTIRENKIIDYLYNAEINTFNGHNIERTNSDRAISYSLSHYDRTIDEVLRDIHFRKPMRDVGKILADQQIQKNIVNVVGVQDFVQMVEGLKNITRGSDNIENTVDRGIAKSIDFLKGSYSLYYLGMKPKVWAKQMLSLPIMRRNLQLQGKNSLRYLLSAALKPMSGSDYLNAINYIATQDPEFRHYIDKFESRDALGMIIPAIGRSQNDTKILGSKFDESVNIYKNSAFKGLSYAGIYLNTTMWLASYNQAMAGDTPGISAGDHKSAVTYASKMTKHALEAVTELERSQNANSLLMRGTLFYGQDNIVKNNIDGMFYNASVDWTNGERVRGLNKFFWSAVHHMALPTIAATIFFSNYYGGNVKDERTPEEYLANIGQQVVFNQAEHVPIIKDLYFALMNDKRDYAAPADQFFNNGYGTARYLFQYASDPNKRLKKMNNKERRQILEFVNVGTGGWVPQWLMKEYYKKEKTDTSNPFVTADDAQQQATNFINDSVQAPSNADQQAFVGEDKQSLLRDLGNFIVGAAFNALPKENQDMIKTVYKAVAPIDYKSNPEDREITIRSMDYQGKIGKDKVVPISEDEAVTLPLMMKAISYFETGGFKYFGNSQSSAKGYFHFIDSTWQSLRERYPELNLPRNVLDASESLQYKAYWKYTGENIADLRSLKVDLTTENLYLIHLLGKSDFIKFIKADLDQDLSEVFPSKIIERNKAILNGDKQHAYIFIKSVLDEGMDRAVQDQIEQEQSLTKN